MNLKLKNEIIKFCNSLSDDDLLNEYYDAVYDSLGSLTDKMYELGYDISDILEREKYEKYKMERADIIENECIKRELELWQNII
jgi:hypothetical protein